MKHLLITILLLFTIQISYAQNADSVLSHTVEISGWEYYFEGDKLNAKKKFIQAIALDSTNILAKIGLVNAVTKEEAQEYDFNLKDEFIEKEKLEISYNTIMFSLLMNNRIGKEIEDSNKIKKRKNNEHLITLKAVLTDSDFVIYNTDGTIRKSGAYKNRKPVGIWKEFVKQNQLKTTLVFPEKGDTVQIKFYMPNQAVFKEKWIVGLPYMKETTMLKEIIYWQETPGKNKEYLFVSKNGFVMYDKGKLIELDENTPNNIIEFIWNIETQKDEAFIWENGKKIRYEYCPNDGTTESFLEDGKVKTFRWENCEKKLVE